MHTRIKALIGLVLLGGTCLSAAEGVLETTYLLSVDFNNKVPGSTLGTGGASQNEPINTETLVTEIIENVPGENYLLVDNDLVTTGSQNLYWEFLDQEEVTTGQVTFHFEFTPNGHDDYAFGVREQGNSAHKFMYVKLSGDGSITANDAAGGISLNNATYDSMDTMDIKMIFDMDNRTSRLLIDDNVLFSDRSFGITERGVGRLLTGYAPFSDGNPFHLDNLSVYVERPVQLPLVLDADFENQVLGQSIPLGGAAVGEPVAATAEIDSLIVNSTISGLALNLQQTMSGSEGGMRFRLLGDSSYTTGWLDISFDVSFDQLDDYQIVLNDAFGHAVNFSELQFFDNGSITITDASGTFGMFSGSYTSEEVYPIQLIINLDTQTYCMYFNGDLLFPERNIAWGNGEGFGALNFGFQASASNSASMVLDNIKVGASSDVIFVSPFE
ncbi:MAG: hypothetical protein R3E90_10085 [Marinicella sp.]|nr:hypothetical protein [Xanthomonadales bacterium]